MNQRQFEALHRLAARIRAEQMEVASAVADEIRSSGMTTAEAAQTLAAAGVAFRAASAVLRGATEDLKRAKARTRQ